MSKEDTGSYRIEQHPLLEALPDREVTRVIVDGEEIYGFVGEPLAITLLAHGIRSSRTMPDSGALRGYFCGVGRCPDCAMTVGGELNVLACTTFVKPGMIVRTQQGLGSWEDND